MAMTMCKNCGGEYCWRWEEAFEISGFNEGRGQIETLEVDAVLTRAGYVVDLDQLHSNNVIIFSIKKKGKEQIPHTANIGYDDPHEYLPQEIIALLDRAFPPNP